MSIYERTKEVPASIDIFQRLFLPNQAAGSLVSLLRAGLLAQGTAWVQRPHHSSALFFPSLLLVAETTPHRYIVSVFFATSIAVDRTLAHSEHWRGFARRSISTYLAIQSIYLYLGSMLTLTLALPKDVPDERF